MNEVSDQSRPSNVLLSVLDQVIEVETLLNALNRKIEDGALSQPDATVVKTMKFLGLFCEDVYWGTCGLILNKLRGFLVIQNTL